MHVLQNNLLFGETFTKEGVKIDLAHSLSFTWSFHIISYTGNVWFCLFEASSIHFWTVSEYSMLVKQSQDDFLLEGAGRIMKSKKLETKSQICLGYVVNMVADLWLYVL